MPGADALRPVTTKAGDRLTHCPPVPDPRAWAQRAAPSEAGQAGSAHGSRAPGGTRKAVLLRARPAVQVPDEADGLAHAPASGPAGAVQAWPRRACRARCGGGAGLSRGPGQGRQARCPFGGPFRPGRRPRPALPEPERRVLGGSARAPPLRPLVPPFLAVCLQRRRPPALPGVFRVHRRPRAESHASLCTAGMADPLRTNCRGLFTKYGCLNHVGGFARSAPPTRKERRYPLGRHPQSSPGPRLLPSGLAGRRTTLCVVPSSAQLTG